MIVTTHRIAGITFRTESDVWLPRLREGPYAPFRARSAPDVRHRIHRIAGEDLSLAVPTATEREQLARVALLAAPEAWESPLLRSARVWSRLHEVLEQPDQVEVMIRHDLVLVRDFARHAIDCFYIEEYGFELEMADWGEDDLLASSPRLHKIPSDSLPSGPLTVEEREHLVRITGLTPHEIAKLPILRSPLLQPLLPVDPVKPGEMLICEYLGGLLIWNRVADTVNFAYLDQKRDRRHLAEKRVARNFPSLLITFLPLFSALMVHCAGVIRNNRATLFLAPDEGGKTTVLKQSPGAPLLSDDQVIVRKEEGEFMAHATPLGLMTSGPCQAPVGGLFVLCKADQFALEPIRPAEVVQAFWKDPGNYTRLLPKRFKMPAFDLFYEACHRVPTYRMYFPKDYVDWAAIDAALA